LVESAAHTKISTVKEEEFRREKPVDANERAFSRRPAWPPALLREASAESFGWLVRLKGFKKRAEA
jgi:hypothetical protein